MAGRTEFASSQHWEMGDSIHVRATQLPKHVMVRTTITGQKRGCVVTVKLLVLNAEDLLRNQLLREDRGRHTEESLQLI